jgi:hypothetical protein
MKKLGLAVAAAAILLAGSVSYSLAQDQGAGGGTKASPGQTTQQRGTTRGSGNAPSQRDTGGMIAIAIRTDFSSTECVTASNHAYAA